MLTPTQISDYRTRLEKERVLLEKELEGLGTRDESGDWVPKKPTDEVFGADKNDNADIIEEEQEANASLNELEARLVQVDAALKKIDDGAYGICEVSGEDIEVERLNANPAAATCMQHMS